MLWYMFVVLLVLWVVGMLAGYTMNGAIHMLLSVALVVLLTKALTGPSR